VVTHQLQVERRTGKVRRPETDVLPLCHAISYTLGIIVPVLKSRQIRKLILQCNIAKPAAPSIDEMKPYTASIDTNGDYLPAVEMICEGVIVYNVLSFSTQISDAVARAHIRRNYHVGLCLLPDLKQNR